MKSLGKQCVYRVISERNKQTRFPLFMLIAALTLFACTDKQTTRRMETLLEKADSMYRESVPMDTFNTMQDVLHYYSGHGNTNEKMKASFFMGCVYRDKDDAPRALDYYRDAISMADTTDSKCDFKLLNQIYWEVGWLFYDQELTDLQKKAFQQAYLYALKSEDTLSAISIYSNIADAYILENNLDSALIVVQKASQEFSKLGRDDLHEELLPKYIDIYLQAEDWKKAKKCIDKQGRIFQLKQLENIEDSSDYGNFIYQKGWYYEGTNQLDSALFYITELESLNPTLAQRAFIYEELIYIYKEKQALDSVTLYTKCYTSIKDSIQRRHISAETARMKSLYSLNESLIFSNKVLKQKRFYEFLFEVIAILSIVVALIVYKYIHQIKRKRREEQLKLKQTGEEIIKAQEELKRMNELSLEQLRQEKEEEIVELEKRINDYENLQKSEVDTQLYNSNIYKHFEELIGSRENAEEEEWKELEEYVTSIIPHFMTVLKSIDSPLSKEELRICILTRLHFEPYGIRLLLDLSPSSVSMKRSRLGKKIYGEEMPPKEFDRRIRQVI